MARREMLEAKLQRLGERLEFEKRLHEMRDVPGWSYVRRGRRAFLDYFVAPQERAVAYLVLHQRALLHDLRMRQGAQARAPKRREFRLGLLTIAIILIDAVVVVQQKLFRGLIRSQRLVARGAVVLPSTVEVGWNASMHELSTAERRAALMRALLDEGEWTPTRRHALLFLATVGLLAAWLVAELLVRTIAPFGLPYKRAVDLLFFYGAATRLFLPTPLEVALPSAARVLGATIAVLVATLGAVVGSWLLFLAGDKAHAGITRWLDKRAWTRRPWHWLEREARRYGYAIMGVILAIPFSPDSLTALFALLGLRLRWFLVTIFVATLVRLSLVVWIF